MRRTAIGLMVGLLLLTCSQGLAGAAPTQGVPKHSATLAKAKKAKPKQLKVMFTDGAQVYADADWQSQLVGTASCGTLLTYQGKSSGEWYLVQFGKKKGWVSGWFASFDTSQPYCAVTFAEAYPPAPTPAPAPAQTAVDTNVATSDTTTAASDTTTADTTASADTSTASAAASTGGGGFSDVIAQAAATYGASYDELMAIWGCETGYTYELYQVTGSAYGPFQFLEDTYYWMASESGYGGSWQDPTDQAYVAAWAFANGQGHYWDCYSMVG